MAALTDITNHAISIHGAMSVLVGWVSRTGAKSCKKLELLHDLCNLSRKVSLQKMIDETRSVVINDGSNLRFIFEFR